MPYVTCTGCGARVYVTLGGVGRDLCPVCHDAAPPPHLVHPPSTAYLAAQAAAPVGEPFLLSQAALPDARPACG